MFLNVLCFIPFGFCAGYLVQGGLAPSLGASTSIVVGGLVRVDILVDDLAGGDGHGAVGSEADEELGPESTSSRCLPTTEFDSREIEIKPQVS